MPEGEGAQRSHHVSFVCVEFWHRGSAGALKMLWGNWRKKPGIIPQKKQEQVVRHALLLAVASGPDRAGYENGCIKTQLYACAQPCVR